MKTVLFLLFTSASLFCWCQNVIVTDSVLVKGQVLSAEDDSPILSATVVIKNMQKFTTSDFEGKYSIFAKVYDTLIFSSPGYKSEEKVVVNLNKIDITLHPHDIINVSIQHPKIINTIFIERGANYLINSLKIETYGGIIPLNFRLSGSLGSNFDTNSSHSFSLSNTYRITKSRYLNLEAKVENQNFKNLQFHQYLLTSTTTFELLTFNSEYYRYPRIKLIIGQLNYDSTEQKKNLGIGIGLSRDLFTGFNISTSYTYWNDINEFNAEVWYHLPNSNWNALTHYRHFSDYEEFQFGIAFNLNF